MGGEAPKAQNKEFLTWICRMDRIKPKKLFYPVYPSIYVKRIALEQRRHVAAIQVIKSLNFVTTQHDSYRG
jgi:hypothetical protein